MIVTLYTYIYINLFSAPVSFPSTRSFNFIGILIIMPFCVSIYYEDIPFYIERDKYLFFFFFLFIIFVSWSFYCRYSSFQTCSFLVTNFNYFTPFISRDFALDAFLWFRELSFLCLDPLFVFGIPFFFSSSRR